MKVPDGLALSEFRGYEDWQTVAVSQTAAGMNVILANPVMIDAHWAGVPGNGKPFPMALRRRRSRGNTKRHGRP